MTWVLPLAMLVVTAVLLLQGCAVLILEPGAHARFAGAATILLAAIGYLSYALLATGALVISPEFDIAMVQGVPAACAFAVILIGGLVAAGTAWHASRCVRRPSSHAWWIVALSVCIGVAALLRVRILNPFDPLSLRIGCYDLWWPAPVVWLSLCLSGWITARLERTPLCAHVCAAALLSAALAAWAVHRSHLQISYINPETRDIWQACVLLALPAAAASGALLAIDMVGIQRQRLRRLLKIVTASLFASASLIAAAWWLSNPQNLSVVVRPGLVVLMSLLVLALALAAAWRLIRYLRSKSVQLSRLVILTLAAVIAGALIERFHFAQVEPKWVLAGFLTLGIVSIECLGGGPLAKLVRWNAAREVLATTDAPLHTFLNVALAGARRLLRGGANVVQNLVPGSLILKTVAIVLALLVLAQIGDAGKTIIVPFSTIGLPAAEKDLGQIVSDRIANTVGVLGQELRPELLVFLPALTPDSGHVEVAVGSSDVGAISASAKTGMLEIPGIGVQIPLALVASPIVSPVRRLLRIRVIQGSIQKEGGHYTLLAGSTNGESWRELGAELNRGTEIPEACAGSAGPQPDEELTALADKIAYDLISTVPNFSAARMSRSACAITLFRSGSYYWRQFELAQDFAALSNSIALLNEAVRVDPKFALAHYRLGRALIADRQPWSAVKAFRAALQASPDLAAAHVALAETLYNLNAYKYTMPPALLSTVDSNKYSDEASADSTESAQREAWLHWSQVAQLPTSQASVSERASAYNGLCLSALYLAAPSIALACLRGIFLLQAS